jgi:hypothetical protein
MNRLNNNKRIQLLLLGSRVITDRSLVGKLEPCQEFSLVARLRPLPFSKF